MSEPKRTEPESIKAGSLQHRVDGVESAIYRKPQKNFEGEWTPIKTLIEGKTIKKVFNFGSKLHLEFTDGSTITLRLA